MNIYIYFKAYSETHGIADSGLINYKIKNDLIIPLILTALSRAE